ncbi:hypothetical protein I308_100745 [Cryptococcus tetragattii IND107]|uniref:BHLH domain-containing protein n=1 Tax=Cryptococcus tetragattii IND107 TaxID=1296105 RepID=A0ABR3C632_9TREE|nr:hypothetical protein I308_00116 [Cryptococcus tetragattii IND107]
MSAIQRPSTPYPYTHTLVHGHTASYFQPHPLHHHASTQPLHFHMTKMPERVPPSLLHRVSSSSSSSIPRSPRLMPVSPPHPQPRPQPRSQPRSQLHSQPEPQPQPMASSSHLPETPLDRQISSCSSAYSPALPTTPPLLPTLIAPTPLTLPPSIMYPSSLDQVEELSSVGSEQLDKSQSHDGSAWQVQVQDEEERGRKRSVDQETRFKRNQTPAILLEALKRLSKCAAAEENTEHTPEAEGGRERVLRSMVDGGAWVVVG